MAVDSAESILITPGQVTRSSTCLHSFWLDCHGTKVNRRSESDSEQLLKAEDDKFEQMIFEGICSELAEGETFENASKDIETTIDLMKRGFNYIAQGYFRESGLKGRLDLMKRVDSPSLLGDYSYVPALIRSRKSATFYDSIQLYFFALLLEKVQGKCLDYGLVLLPDDQVSKVYFTERLTRQFADILRQMNKVARKEKKTESMRCSACCRCLWLPQCSKEWQESNHVSLLSGMSASMVRKLAEHDIVSCSDIADRDADEIHGILEVSKKQCQRFIWAAKSRISGEPLMLKQPEFPKDKAVYFYDIETFEDQVFCHGVIRLAEGQREEKYFFSEQLEEEEKHWHAFLEFLERDENAVVYCWTLYEKTFVDILWRKYGGSEKGYALLKNSLVDQCAFVRDHFALPCRGYSIKAVAPYFDFNWQSPDANGMNCVAWYYDFLHSGNKEVREKIIQYNLDDVRAMEVIDVRLREWVNAHCKTTES